MQDWAGKLLPQMVEGYSRDDVFNGDEFSLSYRNIPKKMHRSLEEQGRYNTEKVTVFVAANWSSSDKLQLVVIGKSKHPVCLKNKEAPIIYRSSQTGLMTREVFEDVMVVFNEHFKQQGRKVLFLVDMCDEHKLLTLSNLKVDFWPPAAAAKLQPLQQGIIPLLRENYQQLFTEKHFGHGLAALLGSVDGRGIHDHHNSVGQGVVVAPDTPNSGPASEVVQCHPKPGSL
ncbi:centromere protein B, putative [Ixodes scapularis]|uniref:Centromere protein B, putative n=1 Tax=Ixodes scapularis TaxID=6945 RepID=B7Q1G4_IXOSC|nr:centromere protein B, putative [Ixodes scapularis]|eukprot:XP_002409603.1 centromere protein B, putative [Ixodes scapularis]